MAPIRERGEDEQPKEYNNLNTDTDNTGVISKVIPKKKNNGEGTYSVLNTWQELLIQICIFVIVALLCILYVHIVYKKRRYDRDGY